MEDNQTIKRIKEKFQTEDEDTFFEWMIDTLTLKELIFLTGYLIGECWGK